MDQNIHLDDVEDATLVDAGQYRHLVGRLLYLQVTRPDITLAINMLSQFVSSPRKPHSVVAMRVLWYLKTTLGQ